MFPGALTGTLVAAMHAAMTDAGAALLVTPAAAGTRAAREATVDAPGAVALATAADFVLRSLLRRAVEVARAEAAGGPVLVRLRHVAAAAVADTPLLSLLQDLGQWPLVPARLPPLLPEAFRVRTLAGDVAEVARAQALPAEQPLLAPAEFVTAVGLDPVPAAAAPKFPTFGHSSGARKFAAQAGETWRRLPAAVQRAVQLGAEAAVVVRLRLLAEALPPVQYDETVADPVPRVSADLVGLFLRTVTA
jgi:hypothetical protein